jgi:hypothetical protein
MKQQQKPSKKKLTPSERSVIADRWHTAKAREQYRRTGLQTGYLSDDDKKLIDDEKWAARFSDVVEAVDCYEAGTAGTI